MNATRGAKTDEVDELLTTLTNRHDRAVVSHLRSTADGVASVDDLTDRLDEQSDDEPVAIRLHHVTLPRLADAGLVEYDRRSETVRYRRQPDLEPMIEAVLERT